MNSSPRVAALAVCVAILLTGCSADDAARGQLAQTAKTAASSTRSAALAVGQHESDRITGPVLDTGLSDAGDKLSSSSANLTSITAVGGIAAERDRILAEVRSAQDLVKDVQGELSAGQGDGKALDDQRRRLDATAERLQKAAASLEGNG